MLKLLATGRSNAELATSLFVGNGSVKTHVSNVLTKLGLYDRVQAVVYARETGLVQPAADRPDRGHVCACAFTRAGA